MSVTRDIRGSYIRPGAMAARHMAGPAREDRALAFVMGACALIFVAQWPYLSRKAHLEGVELNGLLAGSMMAWLLIAPLMLYVIGALCHPVLRLLRAPDSTFYRTRIALFWALLASVPLILLHGLVRGFIGPGTAETLVGALWLAVFLWFWGAGLRKAGWS